MTASVSGSSAATVGWSVSRSVGTGLGFGVVVVGWWGGGRVGGGEVGYVKGVYSSRFRDSYMKVL